MPFPPTAPYVHGSCYRHRLNEMKNVSDIALALAQLCRRAKLAGASSFLLKNLRQVDFASVGRQGVFSANTLL